MPRLDDRRESGLADDRGDRAECAERREPQDHAEDAEHERLQVLDGVHDRLALRAHLLQREADQQRDEQHLQHALAGEGREEGRRDDAEDELLRRLGLGRRRRRRSSWSCSRPSPGWMMLPTTRPIASAKVVMIMKYSSASPPILPTVAAFAIEPTPTTIVQKMIGAIIILMRATKPLPIGSSATPTSGQMQADGRAEHDRDDHRDVEPGVLVPGRLAAPPVVAGELERLGSGDLKSHLRLR